MNAYELADKLENYYDSDYDEIVNMLRQQADRIAVLEGSMPTNFVSKLMADNVDKEALVLILKDRIAELEKELNHMRSFFGCDPAYYGMKQSEPVAWRTHYPSGWEYKDGNPPFELKPNQQLLYTTPQTKPLSDEEIMEIVADKYEKGHGRYIDTKLFFTEFAKAIEAKVRGGK